MVKVIGEGMNVSQWKAPTRIVKYGCVHVCACVYEAGNSKSAPGDPLVTDKARWNLQGESLIRLFTAFTVYLINKTAYYATLVLSELITQLFVNSRRFSGHMKFHSTVSVFLIMQCRLLGQCVHATCYPNCVYVQ